MLVHTCGRQTGKYGTFHFLFGIIYNYQSLCFIIIIYIILQIIRHEKGGDKIISGSNEPGIIILIMRL